MNYTIATMENIEGTQVLSIDKDGNKYSVCFYDKETSKLTIKKVATIKEAEAAFMKIASCFIHSTYSAENRAKMLEDM